MEWRKGELSVASLFIQWSSSSIFAPYQWGKLSDFDSGMKEGRKELIFIQPGPWFLRREFFVPRLIGRKGLVVQLIAWRMRVTHILSPKQSLKRLSGFSKRKGSPPFCHAFLSISIWVYSKKNLHASQRIPTNGVNALYLLLSFLGFIPKQDTDES